MLVRCRYGRCLLSRYRRYQYTSKEGISRLRKIAILESATAMPLRARLFADPMSQFSCGYSAKRTTSALRALDEMLEAVRVNSDANCGSETRCLSSRGVKVSSLSQFISECRRLLRDIGECRDSSNRLLLRGTLRRFWSENIDGALACCASRGRDFGFVAGLGLADDELHVSFASLNMAIYNVAQERDTCSCMDMVLSLHYVARELGHIERIHYQRGCVPGRKKARTEQQAEGKGKMSGDEAARKAGWAACEKPEQGELQRLRRTTATLGLERIHYFFLKRASSGTPLGTAEEALHALEFLSVLSTCDAESSALVLVESVKPRCCRHNHQFVVTSLFRHIASNYKDLKFTSVVHTFRLVRIFLPVICPTSPSKLSVASQRLLSPVRPLPVEGDPEPILPMVAAAPNGSSELSGQACDDGSKVVRMDTEYAEWKRQHDIVDRILWGVTVALRRQDARFINAYHFVQIVETLSRLPCHLLSLPPSQRRGAPWDPEGFEAASPPLGAEHVSIFPSGASNSKEEMDSPEELWVYIVAKACIFVPGMSSDQRRRACGNLRTAVMRRAVCFRTDVEDVLQPMARELMPFPRDYDAVMSDRSSRTWKTQGRHGNGAH